MGKRVIFENTKEYKFLISITERWLYCNAYYTAVMAEISIDICVINQTFREFFYFHEY
jgi:hypothetical protein